MEFGRDDPTWLMLHADHGGSRHAQQESRGFPDTLSPRRSILGFARLAPTRDWRHVRGSPAAIVSPHPGLRPLDSRSQTISDCGESHWG